MQLDSSDTSPNLLAPDSNPSSITDNDGVARLELQVVNDFEEAAKLFNAVKLPEWTEQAALSEKDVERSEEQEELSPPSSQASVSYTRSSSRSELLDVIPYGDLPCRQITTYISPADLPLELSELQWIWRFSEKVLMLLILVDVWIVDVEARSMNAFFT